MKNYMKKLLSFFGLEDDEFDDYELYNNYNEEYNYIDIPEELTEEDKKYKFPITKNHAIDIAYRDENLKTDFFRRRRDYISYIGFKDNKTEVVEINNKKYWQVQILDGEISGIDGDCLWDGDLDEKSLKKLRCLIDVETGKYIYYPHKMFF